MSRRSSRATKKVNYNEDDLADDVVEKAEIAKKAKASQVSKKANGTPTTKSLPASLVLGKQQPLPTRDKNGFLVFKDHKEFRPNLTPKEVLHKGSFGGTYFRSIHSSATGKDYNCIDVLKEFPSDWFEGLNFETQLCSKVYDPAVNFYQIRCGGGLDMWEGSGWIATQDPYGWFHWYCRFYLGRRTSDDKRQISRANGVMSSKGRFRNQLINTLSRSSAPYNDYTISPVIRQTLLHWGYDLTLADCQAHCKAKGQKALPTNKTGKAPPAPKGKIFDPEDMKPMKPAEAAKLKRQVAAEVKAGLGKLQKKVSKKNAGEKKKSEKTTDKAKKATSPSKKKSAKKSTVPQQSTKKANAKTSKKTAAPKRKATTPSSKTKGAKKKRVVK